MTVTTINLWAQVMVVLLLLVPPKRSKLKRNVKVTEQHAALTHFSNNVKSLFDR